MTFRAIVTKEIADLVREKRFGGWALTFLAFWTFVLFIYLEYVLAEVQYRREYPDSPVSLALPAFFVYSIAFVILALMVLSDGITKERESGMLPLVGATPAVRWHIPLAKLVSGLVVYVGAFAVALVPTLVFAAAMGAPVIGLLVRLFAGPFLVLYLFLLGVGLLLGAAFSSSKVAIATGAGIHVLLFLVIPGGPFQFLYLSYPALGKLAAYSPFDVAFRATGVVASGGALPWTHIGITLLLGAACAALAFWLFHRQEVAS